MIKTLPKNSLKPLSRDPRDFKLGAVFGQFPLSEVPDFDFVVAEPLAIKDQGEDTDYCSAYAGTAVSEDQEGVELLPEFNFFETKQISGNPEEWGADLRDACKSFVSVGSIETKGNEDLAKVPRSILLSKENWSSKFICLARVHKKQTFFTVDGKYDVFDNIRAALWQHKGEKCSIITGAMFRSEWLNAPNGVILKTYSSEGSGHAFKIYGQKNINGELYLVAQLSQGKEVGDGGKFYFPREVVNKEIGQYGMFMFKDMSKEDAEYYMGVDKNKPLPKKFWEYIINLFKKPC